MKLAVAALLGLSALTANASEMLAKTPPMGWEAWNYAGGLSVLVEAHGVRMVKVSPISTSK